MVDHAAKIKECLDKYTKYDHLAPREIAHGTYGYVYAICELADKDDSKCPKIVKIVIDGKEDMIAKEITIAQMLQGSGITPELDRVFNCNRYLFIVMDRYDDNLEKRALSLFQQHKVILRTLQGADFPFTRKVFHEIELLEMFRIAKELSRNDIIHGDLKPDQYLWRKIDGKIVVSDFGFSGTSSGEIPAFRGWSWLGKCGHHQPLPPRNADRQPYKRYFNLYQLWSAISCSTDGKIGIVLLRDGASYAFLDSAYYPFASKDHPFHIPLNVLDMFRRDENQFSGEDEHKTTNSARARLILECKGQRIRDRIRIPTGLPRYSGAI